MSDRLSKEQLIERIQYIYETDTGDFKRKVALYLNRFSEEQENPALKKKIQELKDTVLYKEKFSDNEMESVDHLRYDLLEMLKNL